MNKLQMAHEYAMQHLKNSGGKITMHSLCLFAWAYADAMQAEADKREKEEAEKKRKEMRELLNADNTFIEKEGQHFDDVEWQPDWSQAPDWASYWSYDCAGSFWWENKPSQQSYYWMVDYGKTLSSDNFNYGGDWYWSLRKRPQ